jgi:hypothetical protein
MNLIKTNVLTRLTSEELTAAQAQGWFCYCRRKADDNMCGQSRLPIIFVFAQLRVGFGVLPRGAFDPSHATNKQDLKSEAAYCSSADLRHTICQSVLFEGSGQ